LKGVIAVKKALAKMVVEKEAVFWLNVKAVYAKSAAKKCHK
jgi:hypothetical protein